ncbi:MAG: phosphomannomutase/phosphoglucomutase [Acidimicrobiia bacterium]
MNPETAFKAYDIRGRSDLGEIDSALYRLVGNAFTGLAGAGVVAVGRDCRASSPEFFDALCEGITAAGDDVIDVGEVPTDAVYYYSGAHAMPGAMITASHNPPQYNGLKLCLPGARPVGVDSGLGEIKQAVLANRMSTSLPAGTIRSEDIVNDYITHLFGIVDPETIGALSVAVDGGNGMAGIALERVFARLSATLSGLYLEPDGSFPNHPPDPLVEENLNDLVQLMGDGLYDLGVAFDGDADRAFFLDDTGMPLSGSTVTALIARRLLREHPGASIVHNLITSKAVPEIVSENGGTPVRTRVGHSFIKQVMADSGAVFGGEHSGHYYFRSNYRADSGMLAMLVLLNVLSESGRPLSELRLEVERYSTSGEINFTVEDPLKVMAQIETSITHAVEIDHLDGLTVDYGEAWFNLRPSNTEPLLRLNVEAKTNDHVSEIVQMVATAVQGE